MKLSVVIFGGLVGFVSLVHAKSDKVLQPCEAGSASEVLKKIEKGECLEVYNDPSAPSFAQKNGIKTHFKDERTSGNSAADTDMWSSTGKRQIEEDAKNQKDPATGLLRDPNP